MLVLLIQNMSVMLLMMSSGKANVKSTCVREYSLGRVSQNSFNNMGTIRL